MPDQAAPTPADLRDQLRRDLETCRLACAVRPMPQAELASFIDLARSRWPAAAELASALLDEADAVAKERDQLRDELDTQRTVTCPRGLCYRCYADLEVRNMYPRSNTGRQPGPQPDRHPEPTEEELERTIAEQWKRLPLWWPKRGEVDREE